jgi:hypothetical protein
MERRDTNRGNMAPALGTHRHEGLMATDEGRWVLLFQA